MRYIAGIDIGNSSTEVALAKVSEEGHLTILTSSLAETTGIKGTLRNVFGIEEALSRAATQVGISVSDISLIRINEATPVIGDVAMETIDNPPPPDEPEEYLDASGQLRRRPVLPKYHMNVAKPKDKFVPTPFSYEKALAGCRCEGRPNCTFALQYMIYGVDAPKKVDDPLTAAQRSLQK